MTADENGRVTTREFYEAQMQTNKEIADLRVLVEQMNTNHEKALALLPEMQRDIDKLEKRTNIIGVINGFAVILGSYLGIKQ